MSPALADASTPSADASTPFADAPAPADAPKLADAPAPAGASPKGNKKKQPRPQGSGPQDAPPSASLAATKISASVGIVAAMVLATLINVFVGRHFRRWDWTRGGLYTLSDATTATLHSIQEPIRIYVLLPGGDALTLSVQHLLEGYRAETSQLAVEYIDPDRRPADFLAVVQRYGIDVEREEGRVVPSAAAIVVRGDRREIIRQQELIEVDADDDLKRRPRLEQAFTGALRAVQATDHPRACFTTGHGETGSLPLREHLRRNGYEVESVEPARKGEKASLEGCKVLIVAGPTEHVPAEDIARYKAYVEKGGNALVAASPQPDAGDRGYVDLGLADLLGVFGVKLDANFVYELDPKLRSPRGRGETFAPMPRPHPVTQPLMKAADRGVIPIVTVASSLSTTGAGTTVPVPLLVTSDQAFGMVDFFAWAKTGAPPLPASGDRKGPLPIAFAAELPAPTGAAHGGRLVAVGSAGVLEAANWQSEDLKGTALFVESAIAWLTARPPILDIAQKPTFTAGLRVSDAWLAATFRYTVLYMPLAALLIGVAVHLRRRGERRGTVDDGGSPPEPKGDG
ncbi:Mucin 2 precursor [Minicystis rosea]|nr:Mucin 2 precursor [Minicystis rosea]